MKRTLSFFIFFVLLVGGCSDRPKDEYLSSLPKSAGLLEPADSLDLERLGIIFPSDLIKHGRWVAFKEDLSVVKKNITFLNLDTQCVQRTVAVGRGPGEMAFGGNLYLEGTSATLTDSYSLVMVSLDMDALEEGIIPSLDTIGVFKSIQNAFQRLRKVEGGFVSMAPFSNTFGEDAWYSLWDVDGYVSNPIIRPRVKGIEQVDQTSSHAFYCSALMTVHPNKDRICLGLTRMAALSFSVIENRRLRELKRVEYNMPGLDQFVGGMFIRANRAFSGIASDKDYVYLLYSGRERYSRIDETPDYEANHLIVYDWDGNVVRQYDLSRNVSSISVDGNELYCLSTYPYSRLFVYRLPDIS